MGLATALMIIAGALLFFVSTFYRVEHARPLGSLHPRHWTVIWKQKGQFRFPGFEMMLTGFGLLCIGIFLRFLFMGWDSWQF